MILKAYSRIEKSRLFKAIFRLFCINKVTPGLGLVIVFGVFT